MTTQPARSDGHGTLSIPDLPPELIDHIIDRFREDAATLTACSLTHRSMRFRAQFHLFRTICLTPHRWTEYEKLAKKSPHLGCAVRRLQLTQPVPLLLKFGVQDPSGFAQFIKPQVQEANEDKKIVPMFPAATKLDLRRLDHTALTVPLLRQVCDLNKVESVRMHICVVPTMAFVAGFICLFPRMRKLVVSDLFARDTFAVKLPAHNAIEGPVPTRFRPLVETLRFPLGGTLGEVSSISLTKWLFEQSLHVQLTTLEITVARRQDAATLGALLQDLGPRIQHLYLGVEQLNADASLSKPLTLSRNTGLRTLAFWSLKLHGGEGTPKPSLAWVPRLLAELSSPAIEHIYFRLRVGGASPSDFDTLDWAAVNDILCERRFDCLRRVTVEVLRGRGLVDALWPYIKKQMPELHDRAIVCHSHLSVDT